jgi:hypothetical protein
MRSKEASAYLFEVWGIQLSPNTLAKLRVVGGSPPFRYDGRFPIHDRESLDTFALARRGPERTSTSDTGPQAAA